MMQGVCGLLHYQVTQKLKWELLNLLIFTPILYIHHYGAILLSFFFTTFFQPFQNCIPGRIKIIIYLIPFFPIQPTKVI